MVTNSQMSIFSAGKSGGKRKTPLRAIYLYCRQHCCAGDQKSHLECTFNNCWLYPHRFGKRSPPKQIVKKKKIGKKTPSNLDISGQKTLSLDSSQKGVGGENDTKIC